MKKFLDGTRAKRSRRSLVTALVMVAIASSLALTLARSSGASPATTVSLGTADSFAILAGTMVTDVPTSAITGDLGVSPAAGFTIGVSCVEMAAASTIYSVDASGPLPCRVTNSGLLTSAKADLGTAFGDAAGRVPDTTFAGADNQLGSKTLGPGVYRIPHATTANLIGDLTLSGDANSVWIFQATSDLVVQSAARVMFSGGAQACNVFWQVGSSATLGTGSAFAGTIMALTSITIATGATLTGRALAENAAVTLDKNTISRPGCAAATDANRTLYCKGGTSYNLIVGQDKVAPYAALNLTPGFIDPATGALTCTASTPPTTTATTTTAATTTTSTTPTPTPKGPTAKQIAAAKAKRLAAAKKARALAAAKARAAVKQTPKPKPKAAITTTFGFTG